MFQQICGVFFCLCNLTSIVFKWGQYQNVVTIECHNTCYKPNTVSDQRIPRSLITVIIVMIIVHHLYGDLSK